MTESQKPLPLPSDTGLSFDPGLTQQYTGPLKRVVNKNGGFNVRRAGRNWHDANPYTYLISTSWVRFSLLVVAAYIVVNLLFAWIYLEVCDGQIKGTESSSPTIHFLNLFFFSAHTMTTVGYGNMYPSTVAANAVASIEALLGLMTFALATGLLFGRFSQPSARFGFSSTMAIAPYRNGTSLQFRVVNRRSHNLIDAEARVMLMTVEPGASGRLQRKFQQLELERAQILFLPLTWTVVHPIDEKSPLYGKGPGDLESLQAEVVVMMRGFDEKFRQVVHARLSYRYDEIEWGVRFAAAFEVDQSGDLMLWVDRVGRTEPAALPEVK